MSTRTHRQAQTVHRRRQTQTSESHSPAPTTQCPKGDRLNSTPERIFHHSRQS
jgi:hypothetical protein